METCNIDDIINLLKETNDFLHQPTEQPTEQPEIDNKLLIPFLRSLAEEIENGTILKDNRILVGELYMNLNFKKELKNSLISENDMSKFLVLGWYIYSNILKNAMDEGDCIEDENKEDDELYNYNEKYINTID